MTAPDPVTARPRGPFYFERVEDVSGTSGTGRVAQGFVFDDGTVALRWLTDYRSWAVYASVKDVLAIHGHDGKTNLEWQSDEIEWLEALYGERAKEAAREAGEGAGQPASRAGSTPAVSAESRAGATPAASNNIEALEQRLARATALLAMAADDLGEYYPGRENDGFVQDIRAFLAEQEAQS